jgi:hypothetical protein
MWHIYLVLLAIIFSFEESGNRSTDWHHRAIGIFKERFLHRIEEMSDPKPTGRSKAHTNGKRESSHRITDQAADLIGLSAAGWDALSIEEKKQ